jgi:RNA polymerase sigma-70 factor (ECF subfamily)
VVAREKPNDAQQDITSVFLKFQSLFRRVVARTVKPHDIEDIVQETFIRTYESARKQKIRHPRSFMLRTAKNLAINHVTKTETRLTDQVADFSILNVYHETDTVESTYEARERWLLVCRAVRTLPVQCRRVFLLKKVYGFSQRDIAAYLELSESTVEKHIAKGLLRCANFMDENRDAHRDEAPVVVAHKARKTS